MTKKHFIELADVLRKPGMMPARISTVLECYDHKLTDSETASIKDLMLRTIADELADFCKSQNSQFDRERWLNYIAGTHGINGGKL